MFYIHYIFFFFFNDTATTEIYTLSLHDALPIWSGLEARQRRDPNEGRQEAPARLPDVDQRPPAEDSAGRQAGVRQGGDRKSTRLNSSHGYISYAVFCLKKKKCSRP